ncbi:MAG: hypothetical protein LBL66_10600, partial [Clostridiales bacterium]|nr:hypothetical protein [Clostridiales bacterium]
RIYSLYGKFCGAAAGRGRRGEFAMQQRSQKDYGRFCQMLALFAAGNFSLTCRPDDAVYGDGGVNALFRNGTRTLSVASAPNAPLGFDTIEVCARRGARGRPVRFLLIPMAHCLARDKKKTYEHVAGALCRAGCVYDKYVFLDPFDSGGDSGYSYSVRFEAGGRALFYAVLPVSIADMNSFRRIQKLLFECLARTGGGGACAFCGGKTAAAGDAARCRVCGTAVAAAVCGSCGKKFTAAYAAAAGKPYGGAAVGGGGLSDLPDFYAREKKYAFRDIVETSGDGFVCPHCGERVKIES